jgi:DNA-binding transcriptional regulator YdaS (Cro superfamily)
MADPVTELRQQVKAKGSQKAVADGLAISPSLLNDILKGKRNVSESLAARLGYERVIVYRKVRNVSGLS